MLDLAARSAVRNFSTLFLVCMVAFLPLETAYSIVHRDVIEMHDVRPFLEDLPGRERVKGVGADDFERADRDRIVLTMIELALVPLLLAAARRVIERDRSGEIPTATDAYVHGLLPPRLGPPPGLGSLGPLLLATVFSLLVGSLAHAGARIVVDLFPDRPAFVILGVVEAAVRSLALPWFLATWVIAGGARRDRTRRAVGA